MTTRQKENPTIATVVVLVILGLGLFARWAYVTNGDRGRTVCASAAAKFDRETDFTRDRTCLVITKDGQRVPLKKYERFKRDARFLPGYDR